MREEQDRQESLREANQKAQQAEINKLEEARATAVENLQSQAQLNHRLAAAVTQGKEEIKRLEGQLRPHQDGPQPRGEDQVAALEKKLADVSQEVSN